MRAWTRGESAHLRVSEAAIIHTNQVCVAQGREKGVVRVSLINQCLVSKYKNVPCSLHLLGRRFAWQGRISCAGKRCAHFRSPGWAKRQGAASRGLGPLSSRRDLRGGCTRRCCSLSVLPENISRIYIDHLHTRTPFGEPLSNPLRGNFSY